MKQVPVQYRYIPHTWLGPYRQYKETGIVIFLTLFLIVHILLYSNNILLHWIRSKTLTTTAASKWRGVRIVCSSLSLIRRFYDFFQIKLDFFFLSLFRVTLERLPFPANRESAIRCRSRVKFPTAEQVYFFFITPFPFTGFWPVPFGPQTRGPPTAKRFGVFYLFK